VLYQLWLTVPNYPIFIQFAAFVLVSMSCLGSWARSIPSCVCNLGCRPLKFLREIPKLICTWSTKNAGLSCF